jgi:hypothetical protein
MLDPPGLARRSSGGSTAHRSSHGSAAGRPGANNTDAPVGGRLLARTRWITQGTSEGAAAGVTRRAAGSPSLPSAGDGDTVRWPEAMSSASAPRRASGPLQMRWSAAVDCNRSSTTGRVQVVRVECRWVVGVNFPTTIEDHFARVCRHVFLQDMTQLAEQASKLHAAVHSFPRFLPPSRWLHRKATCT